MIDLARGVVTILRDGHKLASQIRRSNVPFYGVGWWEFL